MLHKNLIFIKLNNVNKKKKWMRHILEQNTLIISMYIKAHTI